MSEMRLEMYTRDGDIVLELEQRVDMLVLPPPQAVHIAQNLIVAAGECGYEVQLVIPQRKLSENQYNALVVRAGRVMTNLRAQKKPEPHIAREVVDAILAAAL